MQVPLELTFRGVDRTPALETYIRQQVDRLHRYCPYIISAHVAVERAQEHLRVGTPWRVRVEVRIPPNHQLVAHKEPGDAPIHTDLRVIVRETFGALERQVKALVERQRGELKTHEEPRAVVVRLFREDGYGFIRPPDGPEIYFHRNAVLHDDFDRLEVGSEVRYDEFMGEDGPQATSVQLVSKRG